MPRWASRILLEITEVRVERLQWISWDDALAEGVTLADIAAFQDGESCDNHKAAFSYLWDSLNAKRYPWSMNPWVWVLGFRKVNA